MRLFVAVWPPADVIDGLRGLERPSVDGVRWTTPDQWHVTLRFLGELPSASALSAALHGTALPAATAVMGPSAARPSPALLWLPAFVLLAFVTALGVGLWLSALNVQYRDIQHVVPFLVQAWLFATPVAYPASLLSGPWRTIYGLNPMVGVVEGFRWALLGSGSAPSLNVAVSGIAALLMFITGAFFFRRIERTFADVV